MIEKGINPTASLVKDEDGFYRVEVARVGGAHAYLTDELLQQIEARGLTGTLGHARNVKYMPPGAGVQSNAAMYMLRHLHEEVSEETGIQTLFAEVGPISAGPSLLDTVIEQLTADGRDLCFGMRCRVDHHRAAPGQQIHITDIQSFDLIIE